MQMGKEWRKLNIQRQPNDEALEPFCPPPPKKGYIFYFLFSIFLDVKCYCRGKAFPLKLYTPTLPPTPFTNSFSCTTTSYHVVMWFVRSTIESGFEGNVPYSIIYLSCTHTTELDLHQTPNPFPYASRSSHFLGVNLNHKGFFLLNHFWHSPWTCKN